VALAHLSRRQDSANLYYSKYTGTSTGGGSNDPLPPPVDPPTNPPTPGDIRLKKKNFYNEEDTLFGRKFITSNTTFTLLTMTGNKAIILDGTTKRTIHKKNIINY
jgi:hypothetical protein